MFASGVNTLSREVLCQSNKTNVELWSVLSSGINVMCLVYVQETVVFTVERSSVQSFGHTKCNNHASGVHQGSGPLGVEHESFLV